MEHNIIYPPLEMQILTISHLSEAPHILPLSVGALSYYRVGDRVTGPVTTPRAIELAQACH